MTHRDLEELKKRLLEISHLTSVQALLDWDQATYCPNNGSPARGDQLAVIGKILQEKFTDPEVGHLLDRLENHRQTLDPNDDDRCLLDVVRRDYERERLLSPQFKAEMMAHFAKTYNTWVKAKPTGDWSSVKSLLQKSLDYSKRYVALYLEGPGTKTQDSLPQHPMDPLISLNDYGQKTQTIKALFGELREFLVPFAKKVMENFPVDDHCLRGHFPIDQQKSLNLALAKAIGYDFSGGRIDTTHHPFATNIALGDVRITTRYDQKYLGESISSTIHECGHGMYEQGISPSFYGTPLGHGVSSGIHESQSRLWENIVGRSEGFWQHFYPQVVSTFPEHFGQVSLETFVKAMNRVQKSLIRVDADEVTYNLHVMIRFDLECALLEGKLAIDDLPDAWNHRYQEDLGLLPRHGGEGVMQDVHWFCGMIGGGFQGYTIGNVFSAQIYAAALKKIPKIPQSIAQGDFAPLHDWLRDNLYRFGRKWTPDQTMIQATGTTLTVKPYCDYLTKKYQSLSQKNL